MGRPHGTRGAVRVQLHNPASEALAGARMVRLVMPDGASEERRVRSSYPASRGAVVLELFGSDTVESAQQLRGATVSLPRTELAPAAEGEFYACDLEGCRVVFAGEPIGTVVRVAFYPSCDVLIIARSGGGELEVPLLDGFVAGVDLGARTVELRSLGDLE
ncbi:MAG: 16S rRNA processing protein RimM [Polyangiaceae bacterium]|nr:16S rRNA processing protein RimM [Polyangiaceae bacterium]